MERYCLNCGKELIKGQTKYCSNSCQRDFQFKQYIKDWKEGRKTGVVGTGISKTIRRYLLEKNNYACEQCGWNKINPFSGNSPLEVHHIDGNYLNNNEQNLIVLCPNCHSLTDTYKAMNRDSVRERGSYTGRKKTNTCIDCGKQILSSSVRCKECQNKRKKLSVEQLPVTREELKVLIRTLPFTTIGKQYNVTDNAIRKWCDKFNLPRKKTDINKFSDLEWENI